MIEEVEKSSIIIKKCLMNCDGDFGDLSAPLPNKSFFWIIAGPGGSGKTNLLQNLFRRPRNFRNYFKKFKNIIIASPPSSRASLIKDVFGCPGVIECDELSGDYRTCLIIDDLTSSLKNNDVMKELSNLINNRRHLRLSIFLLVQYYNSIPLQIRRLTTNLTMFKPNNKKELLSMFDELLPVRKKELEKVEKFIFDEPHNFLYLDVVAGDIYKNFNKLKITE